MVWNDTPLSFGGGGGGPSLLFDRPSWQAGRGYGPTRNVPDVSMLADSLPGYAIYCTPPACAAIPGETVTPGWFAYGGTSAAAPLLAGGVADADQEAARRHQPPVGFVNPLLYGVAYRRGASVIRDVTTGQNDLGLKIDGVPIGCCRAHRGYDDASGLGSVDVDAFSRYALREFQASERSPAPVR